MTIDTSIIDSISVQPERLGGGESRDAPPPGPEPEPDPGSAAKSGHGSARSIAAWAVPVVMSCALPAGLVTVARAQTPSALPAHAQDPTGFVYATAMGRRGQACVAESSAWVAWGRDPTEVSLRLGRILAARTGSERDWELLRESGEQLAERAGERTTEQRWYDMPYSLAYTRGGTPETLESRYTLGPAIIGEREVQPTATGAYRDTEVRLTYALVDSRIVSSRDPLLALDATAGSSGAEIADIRLVVTARSRRATGPGAWTDWDRPLGREIEIELPTEGLARAIRWTRECAARAASR